MALSNTVEPELDTSNAYGGNKSDFGNPVDESKYLEVSNGEWDGGPTSFNYQWFRNGGPTFSGGVTISGFTSATYSLRWVDVGQYVYCQVTAINAVDSVIAGSDFRYVFDIDYYTNIQTADAYNSISNFIVEQNILMIELKDYNIWDKLDAFFVFASPGDEYYAMQNWKDPLVEKYNYPGSSGALYTNLFGFQGGLDPSTEQPLFLDTGFNLSDHGVNYTVDDASRFFFPATFSDSSYPMDGIAHSDMVIPNTMWTGNNSENNKINATQSLSNNFNFDSHLLNSKSIHRTSGSDVTLYNGGLSSSRTANSGGLKSENGNMLILVNDNLPSGHTVAAYALGSSLVAEAEDFSGCWHRYAAAIGLYPFE